MVGEKTPLHRDPDPEQLITIGKRFHTDGNTAVGDHHILYSASRKSLGSETNYLNKNNRKKSDRFFHIKSLPYYLIRKMKSMKLKKMKIPFNRGVILTKLQTNFMMDIVPVLKEIRKDSFKF